MKQYAELSTSAAIKGALMDYGRDFSSHPVEAIVFGLFMLGAYIDDALRHEPTRQVYAAEAALPHAR